MATGHAGSWSIGGYKLPDYGITEKIGDAFGGSRTAQGGSNIMGGNKQTVAPIKTTGGSGRSSGSSVLGTSTSSSPVASSNNVNYSSPITNQPQEQNSPQSFNNPSQDDFNRQIDDIYNPQYDYLNQVESTLRGDQGTSLKEAEGQFGVNRQLLDDSKASAFNQTQQQLAKGEQRKEDSLSAARRLYNELQQANRARFGALSSAGQFASELQGRETQRQFGDTRSQFNELAGQVGQQEQEIERNYNTGLMQLEQQKQQAVNQINRDFQNKLLDIANNRSMLGQAKAGARLEALQQLRQQVFAIQQQTIQFQQALEAQRQQAALQMGNFNTQAQGAVNTAGTAVDNFANNTTTTPTSSIGFGDIGRSTQNGTQILQGQISPQYRRDDIYGNQ